MDALEILVVAIAGFQCGRLRRLPARGFEHQLAHILPVHALDVTAHHFAAIRHGAIDPRADFRLPPQAQIAPETGRNLDRQRHFAGAHALVDFLVAI